MSLILGINAFHADASAALIRNGKIVAAAEEERFRRIKHWAGFPSQAISWCLSDSCVSLSDIDHIAINTNPRAHRIRKLGYILTQAPSPRFLYDRWRNKRERAGLGQQLATAFPNETINAEFHFIEHHKCHAASAAYSSGFKDCVVFTQDGVTRTVKINGGTNSNITIVQASG